MKKRSAPLKSRATVLRQKPAARPALRLVETTQRQRTLSFLASIRATGPTLVMDLGVVRANYAAFRQALPVAAVYYAVKANPEHEVLRALAAAGSCFDTASPAEVEQALAAGASASRISYGNTIKKEVDIARAYALGVRLFAADCVAEIEKIARAAPGSRVYCRLLVENEGAEWPLSRKFGCEAGMAVEVLRAAARLGLEPCGVSFHVGSQQPNLDAWDKALAPVRAVFDTLADDGIYISMVNLGGGFPTRYLKDVPATMAYGQAIQAALARHFPGRKLEVIIEPGRGMVGNAGMMRAEVVLVSTKSAAETTRWVYLDIGKFGGLAETMDEAIRYPITSARDGDMMSPCIIAGPTCDSVDVLYEKNLYPLPVTLQPGDVLLIEAAGAYTSSYAAAGFNGFAPPKVYCIG